MIKNTTLLALAAAALLLPASAQPMPQKKLENFKHYEALKEKYLGKQITLYVSHVRRFLDDLDGMPVFEGCAVDSDNNISLFYVRVPKENVEEFIKTYGTEKRDQLYERIPGMVIAGSTITMPMKGELVEHKDYDVSTPKCRLQVYPASKPKPQKKQKPKTAE